MGIFKRNNNKEITDITTEPSLNMKDINKRVEFYIFVIKELHQYISELAFDIEEIDTGKLKKQINELAANLTSKEKPSRLEHIFAKYKKFVSSYITNSKKYLNEKEREFKDVIKILTEGVVRISSENQAFNDDVVRHGTKLVEEITVLDDIKKIKAIAKQEVDALNESVKKKTEKDAGQMSMLSKKVVVLKENLEKAEKASMTDKLTGAFNRLAFDKRINEMIGNMGLRWSSFSLMMIDIDNFKKINDTYGHGVGDRVIAATVHNCKLLLGKNDFVARYGGEEFVIILDGMSLKNAQKKANMICEKIAKTDFLIDNEKPNESISFTVSIGISTFQEGDTALTIVDRADKALYMAKNRGKNRVINEKDLDSTTLKQNSFCDNSKLPLESIV